MLKSLGKHMLFMMITMLTLVLLTGCGKKKEVVADPVVDSVEVEDVVAPTPNEDVDIAVLPEDNVAVEDVPSGIPAIPAAIAEKFATYSLFVNIISVDPQGNEYGVKTTVNKEGDKIAYNIDEMTGPQPLPFESLRNVLIGNDFYMNISIDDEPMWFKATGVEEQAAAMFDLARMHASLADETLITETKDEEIEGVAMTCYYLAGPTESKACTIDDIFAYGEDTDPNTGIVSTIRVSKYTTEVDSSAFELPAEEEIKDMTELMGLMMAQQAEAQAQAGTAAVAELPVQ